MKIWRGKEQKSISPAKDASSSYLLTFKLFYDNSVMSMSLLVRICFTFAPAFFLSPWLQFLTSVFYRLFPKCCLEPSAARLPSTSSNYHYQSGARPTILISSRRKGPTCSQSTAIVTLWPRPACSPSVPLPSGESRPAVHGGLRRIAAAAKWLLDQMSSVPDSLFGRISDPKAGVWHPFFEDHKAPVAFVSPEAVTLTRCESHPRLISGLIVESYLSRRRFCAAQETQRPSIFRANSPYATPTSARIISSSTSRLAVSGLSTSNAFARSRDPSRSMHFSTPAVLSPATLAVTSVISSPILLRRWRTPQPCFISSVPEILEQGR